MTERLVQKEHREPKEIAVTIYRRSGAYLIRGSDWSGDLTDDDFYDASSNLKNAKAIARQMAKTCGFVAPFHWQKDAIGNWLLLGDHVEYYSEWEDDGVDDA